MVAKQSEAQATCKQDLTGLSSGYNIRSTGQGARHGPQFFRFLVASEVIISSQGQRPANQWLTVIHLPWGQTQRKQKSQISPST